MEKAKKERACYPPTVHVAQTTTLRDTTRQSRQLKIRIATFEENRNPDFAKLKG
jgi:hypothetical protein